jgi:hypothetical protein
MDNAALPMRNRHRHRIAAAARWIDESVIGELAVVGPLFVRASDAPDLIEGEKPLNVGSKLGHVLGRRRCRIVKQGRIDHLLRQARVHGAAGSLPHQHLAVAAVVPIVSLEQLAPSCVWAGRSQQIAAGRRERGSQRSQYLGIGIGAVVGAEEGNLVKDRRTQRPASYAPEVSRMHFDVDVAA